MKHRLTAAFVLTLALAGTGWAQLAPPAKAGGAASPAPTSQEQKAITVALTQQKVVKDDKGRETLVEAETVKPGDTLEYRAVYKNVSAQPVKQLAATIPLPEGLEYLPSSAQPRKGVQFAPASGVYGAEPLTRKLPNGRTENLAYSEYRTVRWSVEQLAPGAEVTVVARAKVETVAAPAAAAAAKAGGTVSTTSTTSTSAVPKPTTSTKP